MELREHVMEDAVVQKIFALMQDKGVNKGTSDCAYRRIAESCGVDFNNDGETKNVYLCDTWDFVLKFTNNSYSRCDYPRIEARNYEEAKRFNIAPIFLETVYLDQINDLRIYAQWRYSTNINRDAEKQLLRKIHNLSNREITMKCMNATLDGYRLSRVWLARALQIYGKKFMLRFEKFTHEYRVNDLHPNNLGIYNNRPIILDYAGYHGYGSSSSSTSF